MIANSIKQFRMQRQLKGRSGQNVSKTKERIGLAQRQIADTSYRVAREGQAQEAEIQASMAPEQKIESWVNELDTLRTERAEASPTYSPDVADPSLGTVRPRSQLMSTGEAGKAAAEQYLGKDISQLDWEYLVRATYAESTSNATERAAVMSVILNRTKAQGYPDTIKGVLNEHNQFQAVTGTANDPGPSSMFTSFGDKDMNAFETDVAPLLNNFANQNWMNFTAGNPAAYGEGTDIGFLSKVTNSKGSQRIGGTVFATVGN